MYFFYINRLCSDDLYDKNSLFAEKKIFAIEKTAGVTIAANKALDEYKLKDWTVESVGLIRIVHEILKELKFEMDGYTEIMYRIHKGESPEKIAKNYVGERKF